MTTPPLEDQLRALVAAPGADWPDIERKLTPSLVHAYRATGVTALNPLFSLLHSASAETEFRAAFVLGHALHYLRGISPPPTFPDETVEWITVATRGHSSLPVSEAVCHTLIEGLGSKSPRAQVWAANCLGHLATSNMRVVSFLLAGVTRPEIEVRGWCANLLPDYAVLSVLIDVICDPDVNDTLRENTLGKLEAAAAASKDQIAPSVIRVIAAIRSLKPDPGAYAAIALATLAPTNADIAVPVLFAALQANELRAIHQNAAEALVRIDRHLQSDPQVAAALEMYDESEGYW